MNRNNMSNEVITIEFRSNGAVVETWPEGGDKEAIEARAYATRTLPYEIRNPRWREAALRTFACREVSETEVEVTCPIGTFRLPARRARAGETATSVRVSGNVTGYGRVTPTDQESPPVRIAGRLNEPTKWQSWRFQPSHFVYADGSSSDYLGDYPMDVELVDAR